MKKSWETDYYKQVFYAFNKLAGPGNITNRSGQIPARYLARYQPDIWLDIWLDISWPDIWPAVIWTAAAVEMDERC